MIFHSSIEPIYFILPIIGFIVGLFATVIGGGGGFFFLPVLTIILNVPTQIAVITSLIATLPIGFIGVLGHHKKGNINFRMGLIFAAFGIVGAFMGAFITSRIDAEMLKNCFGVYTVFLAVSIVYGGIRNKNKEREPFDKNNNKYIRNIKASFFGFFGGTISGSFGTSGTGPVLAGLLSMQIPLKMVIGTSLMIVTVNAMSAIAAHTLVGYVDLTLIEFLTIGSLIGALIGPKIISKSHTDNKENKARYIYAFVLLLVGLLMVMR